MGLPAISWQGPPTLAQEGQAALVYQALPQAFLLSFACFEMTLEGEWSKS